MLWMLLKIAYPQYSFNFIFSLKWEHWVVYSSKWNALCVTLGWVCSAAHCWALNNSERTQYRNTLIMEALSTQWGTWMGSTQKTLRSLMIWCNNEDVCAFLCLSLFVCEPKAGSSCSEFEATECFQHVKTWETGTKLSVCMWLWCGNTLD